MKLPNPQRKTYIFATMTSLFSVISNSMLNRISRKDPTSHRSLQNNIYISSPTTLWVLSNNHGSSTTPFHVQIWFKFCHQADPPLSPKHNLPPSSPCLTLNTLYHKFSLSSNTSVTHLPNKDKLNFFNLLTPNPHSLFIFFFSKLICFRQGDT